MIDYIFYRVYWAYNKKRESAKFLSPLYMAMVFAFLFFPFALFLCELLRDSYHRNDGYLLSIYLLMILIYSYLRFFPNKKIWLISTVNPLVIGMAAWRLVVSMWSNIPVIAQAVSLVLLSIGWAKSWKCLVWVYCLAALLALWLVMWLL